MKFAYAFLHSFPFPAALLFISEVADRANDSMQQGVSTNMPQCIILSSTFLISRNLCTIKYSSVF